MNPGYTKPLYLLPFDHRHSYLAGMFHMTPPLTGRQIETVIDSKRVIYDGFRRADHQLIPVGSAGVLVDEQFGADILRDAKREGYVTALSVEKSGSPEFQFEYGNSFARHIEAFQPTFAKALVRYNPEGDAALNQRQTLRLSVLSSYCRATDHRFMVELLIPPTEAQHELLRGDDNAYDLQMRPSLLVRTIKALQNAGVEPDIWKIEGLDRREDCERVVAAARRNGREEVSCIVLGRGADEVKVAKWLETAASVQGFIGFAVGRTTFWGAVQAYIANAVTRTEAASLIARRYSEWAGIFRRANSSRRERAEEQATARC